LLYYSLEMSASFNRDLTVNEIVSLIERQNSKDRAMLVQRLARPNIIGEINSQDLQWIEDQEAQYYLRQDAHLSLVSFKFGMSAVILLNQSNLHLSKV